ncbi:MAG: cell wall hydrolase [Desulfopila sp.]|jgi:N-acetylmuramoyl-L-alanine amidase|nr:cell wall hydrolase [Desulfopila sp.]
MTVLEGLLWLTLNVYHEARSEPQIGQIAVAHVTMNRAEELNLSIKEVVRQPYQFSWTFQKNSYIPEDPQAFFRCMHSVYVALHTHDLTSGSTYYHLDDIDPFWASELRYVNTFGSHKFYKRIKREETTLAELEN